MPFDAYAPDEILKRAAASRTGPTPAAGPTPGAGPTPSATSAAPAARPSRFPKLGRAAGALGRVAGGVQALETMNRMRTEGVTPSNALELGSEAATVAAPQVGIPLQAGMAVGSTVADAAKSYMDKTPFANLPFLNSDPRGPATMAFLKKNPDFAKTHFGEARKAAGMPSAPAAAPASTAPVEIGSVGHTELPASFTRPLPGREPAVPQVAAAQPNPITTLPDGTITNMPQTPHLTKLADGTITNADQVMDGGQGVPAPQFARNIQTPPLLRAPARVDAGPLPTLQAEQGQNVFDALLNFGKDAARYQGANIANKRAVNQFGDLLKAGKFNLDALKQSANVKLAFDKNEREGLESEIKARTQEALQALASGQYSPEQERGLRLLAGLGKGTYKPAIIYGEPNDLGVQQKMTVAVRDDGQVIPITIPGFATGQGAKTMSHADFTKYVQSNGFNETQARQYLERQGFKVL